MVQFWRPPVRRFARCAPLIVGLVLAMAAGERAAAQGRLDAHYQVTLAGLPIGSGTWTVDVSDDQYAMAATGQVSGLFRAFSSGDGQATVRGAIHGARVVPSSYVMTIRTPKKLDEVRMGLASGAVRKLSVEPPVDPDDDERAPLTDAHKRNVVDPISAGLAPRNGTDLLSPDACRRTIPVFDGRQRFDLALSYKRTDQVKAAGYAGPVVVCAVNYNPLGGYHKERFATKFLRDSRSIEIGYAPISGTRFLAMYRVVIPTMLGSAVLQATRFVAVTKAARPASATTRTR